MATVRPGGEHPAPADPVRRRRPRGATGRARGLRHPRPVLDAVHGPLDRHPAATAPGSTDSQTPSRPGRAPSASACEAYRELIVEARGRGRNAMAIWQDLVDHPSDRAAVVFGDPVACLSRALPQGLGDFMESTPLEAALPRHADGPNRIGVSGGRGHAPPRQLKATVCVENGWLGEAEMSYAGPNALARAVYCTPTAGR